MEELILSGVAQELISAFKLAFFTGALFPVDCASRWHR
jgi:hypothetical protein